MNDVTHPQSKPPTIDWKQQIEAWKLSSLSQSQFCKIHDLPYHRFVYWRSKFAAVTQSSKDVSGGFAVVNRRPDSDHGGLTLSLPNGLVLRGICTDNLPLVRQLLDQL